MSKIFVKQQRTLQDYGMGRVDEFPTVPYDPSQLAPGITASINARPTAQEVTQLGFSIDDLQDYKDFMYSDYMNRVNADTDPQRISDVSDLVENARNNAIRQIANNMGGYDKNRKFQLHPKEGETLTNTVNSNYDEAFGTEGNDKSSRDYYANLVRRYGKEGAAEILASHPSLQTNTQLTLPQVIPAYHTENWQNPDGSIKPGAVPPVTAVKQMSRNDIKNLMMGAGLLPVGVSTDAQNIEYEDAVMRRLMRGFNPNISESEREQALLSKPFITEKRGWEGGKLTGTRKTGGTQAGYFISPTTIRDIEEAVIASKRGGGKGMIGIRGLNPIDDFVQQRPPTGQREKVSEGFVSSRIHPSRLVPIQIPTHTIPNTVTGNISYSTRDNDGLSTEEQRVAHILGGVNENVNAGINRGFYTPEIGKKGINLKNLFRLIQGKDTIQQNQISDRLVRNYAKLNQLYAHEESLEEGAEKAYEISHNNTNTEFEQGQYKKRWIEDYIENNSKQYYIDQTLKNIKDLEHKEKNYDSDHAKAVEHYINAIKSFNEQLPMMTSMPSKINLDDKTASLRQMPIEETESNGVYQTESDLKAREKLNFNLDKHGFPLNQDGSAMSLNEKINLVTDPNLKELAQNIFDNNTKVQDQIRMYNTALPFGSDDAVQRKIKPYEFENFLEKLKDRFASAPGEFNATERLNRQGQFVNYLNKLKEEYYGRR